MSTKADYTDVHVHGMDSFWISENTRVFWCSDGIRGEENGVWDIAPHQHRYSIEIRPLWGDVDHYRFATPQTQAELDVSTGGWTRAKLTSGIADRSRGPYPSTTVSSVTSLYSSRFVHRQDKLQPGTMIPLRYDQYHTVSAAPYSAWAITEVYDAPEGWTPSVIFRSGLRLVEGLYNPVRTALAKDRIAFQAVNAMEQFEALYGDIP